MLRESSSEDQARRTSVASEQQPTNYNTAYKAGSGTENILGR